MRKWAALSMLVVIAACSSGGDDDAAERTEPATTSTTQDVGTFSCAYDAETGTEYTRGQSAEQCVAVIPQLVYVDREAAMLEMWAECAERHRQPYDWFEMQDAIAARIDDLPGPAPRPAGNAVTLVQSPASTHRLADGHSAKISITLEIPGDVVADATGFGARAQKIVAVRLSTATLADFQADALDGFRSTLGNEICQAYGGYVNTVYLAEFVTQ